MWNSILDIFPICMILQCCSNESSRAGSHNRNSELRVVTEQYNSNNTISEPNAATLELSTELQNYTTSRELATQFYNTTTYSELVNNLPRVTCATNATNGSTLLHHPETNKCYKRNEVGPCGELMLLYPHDHNKSIGECDCDRSSSRLLVYSKTKKRCYQIFTRGPCRQGGWIDVVREERNTTDGKNNYYITTVPKCKRNPCYNPAEPEKDLVMVNSTCVEVGGTCKTGHVIGFRINARLAGCFKPSRGKAVGVPKTPCAPGTHRAMDGRCQPPFDFDWGQIDE